MMSDTTKLMTVSTLNTNPADRHTTAVDGGGIIDDGGGVIFSISHQKISLVITNKRWLKSIKFVTQIKDGLAYIMLVPIIC